MKTSVSFFPPVASRIVKKGEGNFALITEFSNFQVLIKTVSEFIFYDIGHKSDVNTEHRGLLLLKILTGQRINLYLFQPQESRLFFKEKTQNGSSQVKNDQRTASGHGSKSLVRIV